MNEITEKKETYYLKHKAELNRANAEYKRLKGIRPSRDVYTTYSKTNKLIKQGLIVEQSKCCICGKTQNETRLLNHHAAGYQGDFAASCIMRCCYSCHSKLHWNLRKQEDKQ